MTGLVVFAVLLCAQSAFGQTRPHLSEVFQSPVTIEITTGTGADADPRRHKRRDDCPLLRGPLDRERHTSADREDHFLEVADDVQAGAEPVQATRQMPQVGFLLALRG